MSPKRDLIKWLLAGFVLLFTFFIYVDTMAPTVSFWDCGEFIAVSHTLSVPHPPGSPLYLLLGRIFSILPFNGGAALDPVMNQPEYHTIAYRINMMSPIVTAFANMFLFLVIVRLVTEWRGQIKTATDKWIAYGGGFIGSLALAFSDSHWFNAVEAEVYAMSVFFTAIVVWLILKWAEKVDEGSIGARYILLISYMMGLAISVHMLNLLTIPFIALIMYAKLNPEEDGVEMMLHMLGVVVIGAIGVLIAAEMILPDTSLDYLRLSGSERSSKLLSFGVIALGITGAGLYGFSQIFKGDRRRRYWRQTLLMVAAGAAFLLIEVGIIKGIPKFARLVANVLNTNDAVAGIGWTLILGTLLLMVLIYLAPFIHKRFQNEIRLSIMAFLLVLVGYSSYQMIFIRSSQDPMIDENDPETVTQAIAYLEREQYGSYPIFYRDRWEETPLTNAAVREGVVVKIAGSDRIGVLTGEMGNSRDQVIVRLGNRNVTQRLSNLSEIRNGYRSTSDFFWRYQVNHMYVRYFKWQFWGRDGSRADFTQLWALPLLLGLVGMAHQFSKDSKRAFSVLALFIMTGLAIIIYLNQDDPQPRERDYSYTGSFFAFAIWIGIGASAVLERLVEWRKKHPAILAGALVVMTLAVPVNMLFANYHTHDRSGNYVAWEYSYNLLNTCEPNALIFTNGDNDTFPLWYLQEVEGIRKDVRVVNLSLLNTPWYIKQLKNMEPKVPMSLSDEEIEGLGLWRWEEREMRIPGPKQTPRDEPEQGSFEEAKATDLVWTMKPTISRQRNPQTGKLVGGLRIQDVMIYEIIRVNQWKKPIYFAVTVSPSNQLGLEENLRMDGQAYRLVPEKVGYDIDPDVMYKNIVETYRYTNLNDPDVYYPDNVKRLLQNYRKGFLQLVYEYGFGENRETAKEILRFMDETIPDETIPITFMDLFIQIVQLYDEFDERETALRLMERAFGEGRENASTMDRIKIAALWNDRFDAPDKSLDILLPLAEASPGSAQLTFEVARAYVKAEDVSNGLIWVDRLEELVPNARETQVLREQLKAVNEPPADTIE